MDFFIIFLVLVTGTLSQVDSYRADFNPSMPLTGEVRQQPAHMIQQQQGCVWSTQSNDNNNNKNGTTGQIYPPFLQQRSHANSFSLDCHLRTLNSDFWSNYSFTREQLESTSRLSIKCNDKLFFESVLEPTQSYFRLRNLQELSLQSCKIRKVPTRIWASLGFLKSLTISSLNGEWSSAVGMDIEGAFEGLLNLEKLDLSQNNIWAIHDKNVFCPLRSLLKLNMSRNRLSDLEDLGFGSSSTFRLSNNEEGSTVSSTSSGSCVMNIQNLDLSHNTLRRLNPSAFNRLRKLSELRLENNLIEILEDTSFQGLAHIRLLNISSNRLVALPPTIFKPNPTLREINLSNNSVSALSPQVFSGLTTLLSLDLSRNSLTSQWITGNMFHGLTRLIILRLNFNKLSYIDGTIFKDLINLQALHLDNNRIETINPGAFQNLKNLHSLDISNNRLSLIDGRLLSTQFVLKQLYLDHNRIGEIDDNSFKNCTNLQDLGLGDNLLQEVPQLGGLKHLVTLDLGENKLTSVSNASFHGLSQLYGLRLVDNQLSELSSEMCPQKLRVLNVASNRISKISNSAFKSCPELRALRLDTNALEELPTTLTHQLPSLLWLNVSQNHIRWADYHILPPTIEWIDISYNALETLGGPVSDGGKDNIPYSLRVMDASHNKLTNLDYTSIPPTLETLRLNYNLLKTVQSDTFIRNSRLIRVELIGNQLENLPLSALRFPVVPKKPLPEFYIRNNPFVCDCSMEWMSRVNQFRQLPNIPDLDAVVCRRTFPSHNQTVPLREMTPNDFLCPYKSHCFSLCHCCDFEFCDCEMRCPDRCSCFHDTAWSSNVVECSNLNFTEIPSRIPMDATEVYLDGNVLPELGSHIFIGKKNVRVLHLNGSNVETIKNKTFNGLKSLEVLRLNDNLLTELRGHELADLGSSLKELYLQNNLITFIGSNVFAHLSFLQVLRLDGNRLSTFSMWQLSENGYLNSLMLSANPWSCDCSFLIPFRTWVSSKITIVVDFKQTTCQPELHVGSNSTTDHGSNDLQPQLIINMCDHNKELNFNFNPNSNDNINIPALLDSELLNSNHISAEKVASSSNDMNILMGTINSGNNNNHIPHHNNYPSINDISSAEETVEKESSELWTIFTSVLITLVIVLLVIAFLVFRKDSHSLLPFWLYSWLSSNCCYCGGGDDDDVEENASSPCSNHRRRRGGFISSLFHCCCGGATGQVGKKSRSSRIAGVDDADKLFDAYFLYSRKDEDLLVQKIAPELESPSSGYSAGTGIPPPPPPHHHAGNPCYYRLCLHYRDLCLSAENPLNTDMVLSACDASKRIVLVISRPFLQNELSHPGFRSAIQTAINRYQNKLIFILLPPFTEQNLLTIYPELKAGHFTTMTMTKGGTLAEASSNSNSSSQITSLEWSDKNFWSKLKLILPTPTVLTSTSSPSGLNSTSTISSTGSSAIFNMAPAYHPHHHANLINYNNSLSLHEYAYNTINSQHQYHRNILPFNANNPQVPKHHIALTTPAWQQQQQQQLQNQNFYNNSQHSQIIPIPGYPVAALGGGGINAATPLMVQNAFHQQPNVPSFNESFRRHLQQNQNKVMTSAPPAPQHHHHLSNCSQGQHQLHHNHHHHQGSHCSSSHSSSTSNNNPSIHPYQPLDANYSSSSSNEELLDHVYSTLDSPPIMSGSAGSNNNGCDELVSKQINNTTDEQDNKSSSENRLNNNNTNCPVANNTQPSGANNNGTMYFV